MTYSYRAVTSGDLDAVAELLVHVGEGGLDGVEDRRDQVLGQADRRVDGLADQAEEPGEGFGEAQPG